MHWRLSLLMVLETVRGGIFMLMFLLHLAQVARFSPLQIGYAGFALLGAGAASGSMQLLSRTGRCG